MKVCRDRHHRRTLGRRSRVRDRGESSFVDVIGDVLRVYQGNAQMVSHNIKVQHGGRNTPAKRVDLGRRPEIFSVVAQ